MINILKTSFKIDFNYAFNSFIYNIRKIKILDKVFYNFYEKKWLKNFVSILAIICTSIRLIFTKVIYLLIIYIISYLLNKNSISDNFIHIFYIFSLIGMVLNTNILNTSRKKYISIILFGIDAKKFLLSHFLLNSFISLFLNITFLTIIFKFININISIALLLSILSFFSKTIGEAFSLKFYLENKYRFLDNNKNFLLITIIGLLISFLLPYFNFYIDNRIILINLIIFIFLYLFSLKYMFSINNYKYIYKQLNSNNNDSFVSSNKVFIDIKDKDIKIDNKKLKNKKGYELFNAIFFERHKSLLLRSVKIYALILFIILIIIIVVIIKNPIYKSGINKLLMNNLSLFVIIMYFINRGEVVTKAMFYNCDHYMLTFNFYRNRNVILNMFKIRLKTLIKINLIPALVIGILLPIILYISGGAPNISDYFTIFLFIIITSVFFSVHYLTIYYLLQPYTKNLELKNPIYKLVVFITYYFCYILIDLKLSTTLFTLIFILLTVIYIFIALVLVYKTSYKTFKLK